MEWGETPERTALRELTEETGLTARIGPPLGVLSCWFHEHESSSGEPAHIVGIICSAYELRGELRPEFAGTTDAVAWFSLDEARFVPHVPLVDFTLDLIG